MILIVGCGLSGVVCAERLASLYNEDIVIVEKNSHIGGLCYDYIDEETGILVNKYGAHLFHTNNSIVWDYINKFDLWLRWDHKVLAYVDNMYVPMPINITTINMICNNHNDFIDKESLDIAINKLIRPYTYKQWGKKMEDIPSVINRIKPRNNYEVRYFTDKYQALPSKGYTHFMKRLLNNPKIKIKLNTDVKDIDISKFSSIIVTGAIDKFFQYMYGPLEYRSVKFSWHTFDQEFYQTNSVINYPSLSYPYTRIVEYKHFLNQQSPKTIISVEYPSSDGIPMYPVPTEENIKLYNKYKQINYPGVYFIGRLANYKYFNMDEAILNSLNIVDNIINDRKNNIRFLGQRYARMDTKNSR